MLILMAFIFWLAGALFAWTYAGYPLLMYLRARRVSAPPACTQEILPALTLLIPTHNEADIIRRKLDNCAALDYPPDQLQILVVDDGSTDGTPDIVAEHAQRGVTLLRLPARRGKMHAVNVGFQQASGEIVVLSDASPSYERQSLTLLAQRFSDPTVGVVVGALAIWDSASALARPAGLYWRYEAALRRWESATGSTVAVHGNMFAIRRRLFTPLKTGTINDEFSLAMEALRQDYRVVYEPEAISYDDASSSLEDEFHRRARINAGRYQALFSAGYLRALTPKLAFRLVSHKLLRPLTPVFMLLMLLTNAVLALGRPSRAALRRGDLLLLRGGWASLFLTSQVTLYGLAVLGWQLQRRGRRHRLLNILTFFVSSNLAALVGLWRWLRGSQRVTWQKRTTRQ